MRIFLAAAFLFGCLLATQAEAQYVAGAFTPSSGSGCKPEVVTQIAEVRDTWVKDWNAKNLDGVTNLYAPDASLLPADGNRFSDKQQIRAYFEKQIGSTVAVRSVKLDCSGELAYDSGTYTQDSTQGTSMTLTGVGGQHKTHVEGNYLVVLKLEAGKWIVVQHASTAKPTTTKP